MKIRKLIVLNEKQLKFMDELLESGHDEGRSLNYSSIIRASLDFCKDYMDGKTDNKKKNLFYDLKRNLIDKDVDKFFLQKLGTSRVTEMYDHTTGLRYFVGKEEKDG